MTTPVLYGFFLVLVALCTFTAVWAMASTTSQWVPRLRGSRMVMELGSFPMLRLLVCLGVGLFCGVGTGSLLWGASSALLLGFLSRLHTQWQTRQRKRQVERQLPEFCDAVSGALRAGASLRTAIAQARDQLSLPIRGEIDRLLNLLRLGLSQEEALTRWAENSGLPAMKDLAFCAGVSSRSGGSLAPLVESIGHNLAAELALQSKADALTSQGRLQAIVMIGIPPALLFMTGLMDPSVWSFFFQSQLGSLLLWVVALLEGVGLIWIRKITQVRRAH
ncbi:MAG: hypothetical protein RLY30_1566 [Pseudomonadota bacterium]